MPAPTTAAPTPAAAAAHDEAPAAAPHVRVLLPGGAPASPGAGPDDPWDLLVVGGGTAGLVAAQTAAGFGARVLLVERARTGGDCLWTGCVPSKALVAAASAAATARGSAALGVHAGEVRVAFDEVMAHVRGAIDTIAPVDSPAAVRAAGADVAAGTAVFTGPDGATVDGVPVRFRQALVATGAAPVVPPGLAPADPLTSDTVWDLTELPDRLVVLGGGAVGCELGQAFARLGSRVTIVEAADRLLPAEDEDASALVRTALADDGVDVRTGVEAVAARRTGGGRSVELSDGSTLDAEHVLVALGRSPRTAALGLAAAGVELDARRFVRVDERLRTSNPRIWAAGDVTGFPQFTHTAGIHGSIVAGNAVLGLRRRFDPTSEPRVTFTRPEVAAVGAPTGADHAADHRVLTLRHDHVDRAIAAGDTAGFARLAVDARGRIVGATLVGPRAGEALAEVTLAVRRGLRPRDLAGVTHPYPTYGDGVWNATIGDLRRSLATGPTASAIAALRRARRAWLDLRATRR